MRKKNISRHLGIVSCIGAGLLSAAAVSAAEGPQDCPRLPALALNGAKIISAKEVPAGSYTQPDEGSGPHTFNGLRAFAK